MGNSMLVGRTSLTIIIFLNSLVFYSYLSLRYQMPSVCPVIISFQIEFSSLYLTNCFRDYKPQVNSKILNERRLRILKSQYQLLFTFPYNNHDAHQGEKMHGWIGCLSRKLLLCCKIKICLAAASVLSRILPFPIQYTTEKENQWRIFLISRTFLCFFNFIPSCSRGAHRKAATTMER